MLEWFRKRLALRRIVRRLPRELVNRYGATDSYAPSQVLAALEQGRYDLRYSGYALAMFVAASEAAAQLGGAAQLQSMRAEIADRYFHGDANFSLDTARDASMSSAHHDSIGSMHGGADDGAGGFGDGGGGL